MQCSFSYEQWMGKVNRCRTCCSFLGTAFFYFQTISESLETALRQKRLTSSWVRGGICHLCKNSCGYKCTLRDGDAYFEQRVVPQAFAFCREKSPSKTFLYHNIPIVIWTGGRRVKDMVLKDNKQERAALLKEMLYGEEDISLELMDKMGKLKDYSLSEKVLKIVNCARWYPEYSYSFVMEALQLSGYDEEILSEQMQLKSFISLISNRFETEENKKVREENASYDFVDKVLNSTEPFCEKVEPFVFSLTNNKESGAESGRLSLYFDPTRELVTQEGFQVHVCPGGLKDPKNELDHIPGINNDWHS